MFLSFLAILLNEVHFLLHKVFYVLRFSSLWNMLLWYDLLYSHMYCGWCVYLDVIMSSVGISLLFASGQNKSLGPPLKGLKASWNQETLAGEGLFWMRALGEGNPIQSQRSQSSIQHLQLASRWAGCLLLSSPASVPLLRSALFRQMGAQQVRKAWPLRFFLFQSFKEPMI